MDMLGKRKIKILSPCKVAQSVISHHEPGTCTEIVEVDLKRQDCKFWLYCSLVVVSQFYTCKRRTSCINFMKLFSGLDIISMIQRLAHDQNYNKDNILYHSRNVF